MKKLIAAVIGSLLILAVPVGAQQSKSEPQKKEMPAAKLADDGPTKANMQEGMKHMQEVMAKIYASKDSKERQALLDEHMKLMRDQMKGMRGMMGPGMGAGMGQGKMGGGMPGSGMMGPDMMKNHEAMVSNMQMMHGMMEQMMEHMDAEHGTKNAPEARKDEKK